MFRRFLHSHDGNIAAIFAIAAMPLLVAVAGAVDLVETRRKADQVQQALDATVLAMASLEMNGAAPTSDQAEEFFRANLGDWSGELPSFNFISAGDAEALAVLMEELRAQAVVTAIGEGEFIRGVNASFQHEGMMALSADWNVSRQAVVRIGAGLPACLLALNEDVSSAIEVQGSTQISMAHCVLAANSGAEGSISRSGSATIAAECLSTVGTVTGFDGGQADLECEAPLENRWPSLDPLRDVAVPNYTGCQRATGSGKEKVLTPGTYCNERISGQVTLEPGTYILRGGEINLKGNGSLVGEGVTIFLLDDARFSIGANQIVQISPPTSGLYQGISIYQEMGNANAVQILGTSGSSVSGIIYAPSAHVQYAGNASANAAPKCLRIVADTIEMTGNSTFESDCSDEFGGREMEAEVTLSLIR